MTSKQLERLYLKFADLAIHRDLSRRTSYLSNNILRSNFKENPHNSTNNIHKKKFTDFINSNNIIRRIYFINYL